MTLVVVDRIEGEKAVLVAQTECGEQFSCPLSLLPCKVKEGDMLRVSFQDEPDATRQARLEAENLLKELLRDE